MPTVFIKLRSHLAQLILIITYSAIMPDKLSDVVLSPSISGFFDEIFWCYHLPLLAIEFRISAST